MLENFKYRSEESKEITMKLTYLFIEKKQAKVGEVINPMLQNVFCTEDGHSFLMLNLTDLKYSNLEYIYSNHHSIFLVHI